MFNRKLKVKNQKFKVIKITTFFLFSIFYFLFIFSHKVNAQVVINEFLPNSSPEWVEFYNSSSASIDLVDYYFDDDNSLLVDGQLQIGTADPGSDPVKLSGVFQALATCYLDLTTYLNNDGDTPSLLLSNGNLIDSYTYTSTQSDKSFSRIPDGGDWQTNQAPTKSSNKCSDLAPSPSPSPTHSPTPSPTPTPTATPTSSPTPTSTKTSTPSPKTPSPTPKTPTPTPASQDLTSSSTTQDNVQTQEIVLGLQQTPTPTASPQSGSFLTRVKGWAANIPIFPVVFIIVGGFLIVGTIFAFVQDRSAGINNDIKEEL